MKATFLAILSLAIESFAADANRLNYLELEDPVYPGLHQARLTTPQWIGENGVEAVVILSIDDLRETAKFETYLRPVIERLKQIDGRAPISVMSNQTTPGAFPLQTWLKEGLSLEVHTLTHPCPLLKDGDFAAAAQTFHGCIDLLAKIPGNHPVAFRMPCCDSMNSPSPRFFGEIFPVPSPEGRFLAIDSSVMCLLNSRDPSLPRELVLQPDGGERFTKYFPQTLVPPRKRTFESFSSYIENYPYPYVIGSRCWEFPCAVPSDWEAFNCHGAKNSLTLEDWKANLDATVLKQGVMTMILHPHGWSDPQQIVALIDHAVAKYGPRVKFLNFREALQRLEKNLLVGQSLRAADGGANGIRLLDLNNDGFMDVVSGNARSAVTRVWDPKTGRWNETPTPIQLTSIEANVHFGVMNQSGAATMLATGATAGAWEFTDGKWEAAPGLLKGADLSGKPAGFRLHDFDGDGICELLVSDQTRNAIYGWKNGSWELAKYALPEGVAMLDAEGRDNGLRFVDLNGDGLDDVLLSNAERYAIYLWAKNVNPGLGWKSGWSLRVRAGSRTGQPQEPPAIVRAGPHRNNGAWINNGYLTVQNEDTSKLDGVVDRRSFKELIAYDIPPPKSPEDSLSAMHLQPGFKIELVASEPMVMDPVAFEWDARGRLWVVEMGDYPQGLDGKGKPGGLVRILEDRDCDGRYEHSSVFLDGLSIPTGVQPWRKGVLIAAGADLIYAEDTDGDGQADVRKVLFTGFIEGNQQHRFNGFELGLDNWVYCANGDSGGAIKSVATGKVVDIRGRDFRFRPETGEMEAIEGQTQYGRRSDDWGNWFGNFNSAWLWHYPIPEHYVARNRFIGVRSLKQMLANYPGSKQVFALSAPMLRFNQPESLNEVTSACSAAPYRDEWFGPGQSVFISEPVYNVVHREILVPEGVSFSSHRADGEQASEFLASEDNWFRPTMLKTGPDGALYIADMYRFVLEHPQWIAPETQERLDLRAGADKGRIYRVFAVEHPPRPIPNLEQLKTGELIQTLDSSNGWQRTTAQRLLIERGDPRAREQLVARLADPTAPVKARLHALCSLDGLGALALANLQSALRDPHPAIRQHAVRLCEPLLAKASAPILEALKPLVEDAEIRVRYQLAYSLGECADPRAGKLLAQIAAHDGDQPQLSVAILSSALPHLSTLAEALHPRDAKAPPPALYSEVLGLVAGAGNPEQLKQALSSINRSEAGGFQSWQFNAASRLLDEIEKKGEPQIRETLKIMEAMIAQARRLAQLDQAVKQPELTIAALGLLGRDSQAGTAELALLSKLLLGPPDLQAAAASRLARFSSNAAAEALLAPWTNYGRSLREEVVRLLLTRPDWADVLLGAVEGARIPAAEIGSAHRQVLLKQKNESIRSRANRLFASNQDRQKVVQDYLGTAALTGNAENGREIFRAQCVICHRFKGDGIEVGPDLGMVSAKPLDFFLTAILNPNLAIEARYLAYALTTKDGRAFSGIISSETANQLVIKSPGGMEQTVLRSEIKELTALGRSLMPEGLEQAISQPQMADLVRYLQQK